MKALITKSIVLEKIQENDGGITYDDLLVHFGRNNDLVLEIRLKELLNDDIISFKRKDNKFLYYTNTIKKVNIDNEPVFTIPEYMKIKLPNFKGTVECIQEIIKLSTNDIILISPYIDSWFVEKIEDNLRNFIKIDGKVTIYTRQIKEKLDTMKAILR
ncbi:hypothetical protein ACFL0D_06535, partial [Thermoproteota archaeon]